MLYIKFMGNFIGYINNLAQNIDNFQYIRERIIEFLCGGFDAAGC